MEPTFEEFCNTSPKESQPNLRQSWMVVFAMVSWPFSAQMRSSGRTTPSSRAAAARMTLNVEPGSKGSVTARLRQTSREDTARNALGLNVGRRASASTSPVRGSIAIAIAARACVRRYAASISRSARYWIVVSSVSITPRPRGGEDLLARELAAQRIAPHDRPARGAGERVVPRALHALEPAVHALEAEHVRRQLAVGIETQRLVQEPEPRLAERAHPRDDGRRQLAPQPDEGLAGGELRVQLALRRVEDRRQPRGDAHGIAQRARLGGQ